MVPDPEKSVQDIPIQVSQPQMDEKRSRKPLETHTVPENRLSIVFLGLMACTFLAAIDQTIVATALPTIVSDIGGGENYSWVGSAYMLAAAALSPLYGKASDLFGRKPILYSSIVIFLIGSAVCGAAQNMVWLIVCRAVQGVGGGGIIQLVNITISDIVPLQDRGKYGGFVGTTWGVASVVGPLLGGVFTDSVSWRWCFWINLPTGGIATLILFFFLNLNPHQGKTLKQHYHEFDFLGLFSIVSGVVLLLLGFHNSETSWRAPETIALLAVGGVVLICSGVWETQTKRSPIIPPRLFKTRTTSIILISSLLHAIGFFCGAFYLPVYYQILGSSATGAGVRMLPYSLGAAVFSAVSGILVSKTGEYRIIMWIAWGIMVLGFGLMTMLGSHSSVAVKEIYPLITAVGVGCLFQVPLVGLQAAMPIKDMATSTGTFGLIRTLGGTVGISVGQAIFSTSLDRRLRNVPNASSFAFTGGLSDSIRNLREIQDPVLRSNIIEAFARSISSIWVINTPLLGVGFILVLFIRKYTLKRIVVRAGKDAEQGNRMSDGKGETPNTPEPTPTPTSDGQSAPTTSNHNVEAKS